MDLYVAVYGIPIPIKCSPDYKARKSKHFKLETIGMPIKNILCIYILKAVKCEPDNKPLNSSKTFSTSFSQLLLTMYAYIKSSEIVL